MAGLEDDVPVAVAVAVAVAVGDVVVGGGVVVGVGVRVGVGDADVVLVVGVGDVVMVWVGAVVACVAVDVMAGWVIVAVCADVALADAVGCLRGVAEADADADADALLVLVADEICAAGDWAGVVVCPCELRAKAAPTPPSTSTPRTPASTSDQRRRGGPPVPDGASPITRSGGEPSAGVDQA